MRFESTRLRHLDPVDVISHTARRHSGPVVMPLHGPVVKAGVRAAVDDIVDVLAVDVVVEREASADRLVPVQLHDVDLTGDLSSRRGVLAVEQPEGRPRPGAWRSEHPSLEVSILRGKPGTSHRHRRQASTIEALAPPPHVARGPRLRSDAQVIVIDRDERIGTRGRIDEGCLPKLRRAPSIGFACGVLSARPGLRSRQRTVEVLIPLQRHTVRGGVHLRHHPT